MIPPNLHTNRVLATMTAVATKNITIKMNLPLTLLKVFQHAYNVICG